MLAVSFENGNDVEQELQRRLIITVASTLQTALLPSQLLSASVCLSLCLSPVQHHSKLPAV